MIESLYAAGRCPRLHVNAMYQGVVCPDFIREQWRERLIIDLDPSYPLDLTFEAESLAADLSFGGYVTRCTFPYSAVYVVADRSTGRGIVLDQNMPESVKRTRYGKARAGAAVQGGGKPQTALRSVDDDTVEAESTSATPDANAAPGPTVKPKTTDEAAVQKRRASFKVIDGGNS